jgi:spore coat protein CotH
MRPFGRRAAGAAAILLLLAGCSTAPVVEQEAIAFYDRGVIHSIELVFDPAEYEAMIAAFRADGSKEWVRATATIDGTVLEDVGLRLKGNLSLTGILDDTGNGTVDARDPATIPWLIRLDEYVEGQQDQGRAVLIVRGSGTRTALNEAVALELLGLAGLATQRAAAVRLSANGGEPRLRLVVESPDDPLWSEDVFPPDGITWEAGTDGDYSYRGEDESAYDDVFSQQSGEPETLRPVIELLAFVDSASDAEFIAGLERHLDTEAFATYLALQELIGNLDDIDGPGNNSYLHWDAATGLITVVAWDHNLAFGAPLSADDDGAIPGGAGLRTTPHPLADRFRELFADRVDAAAQRLTVELIDSGAAPAVLESWAATLTGQAPDLVDPAVVAEEAAAIAAYLRGGR